MSALGAMKTSEEMFCIPVPPPDEDCASRIKKLVGYVCRNGVDFENMVREKEKSNEKFDFLRDGEGADYYKWLLFCGRRHYSEDTVNRIESRHRERISAVSPGCLDLSPADKLTLTSFLSTNTGSKENVKSIRKWMLERAHSMVAIAAQIQFFVCSQRTSSPEDSTFAKLLHTVYILNDIFFNRSAVTMKGPYTRILGESWSPPAVDVAKCFSPHLPSILHRTYSSAPNDTGKERLRKLVDLWISKNFISCEEGKNLHDVLSIAAPPSTPAAVQQYPPHAIDLPPAILPPVPPAPPPPSVSAPMPFPPQSPYPHSLPPGMQHSPLHASGPPGAYPPGTFPPYPPRPPGMPHALQSHTPPPGMLPPGVPPYGMPPQAIPPSSAPLPPPTAVDLQRTGVGAMANIIRNALKMGHAKYTPFNPATLGQSIPPFVEPGRLEARVSQFYRKLEDVSRKDKDTRERGDRDDSRREYGDDYDDDDGRDGDGYRGRGRDRDTDRDKDEDGYGGKRRRRGNSFSDSAGQYDRNGLGSGENPAGASTGDPDFDAYRTMQSSGYHTRMANR